VSESLAIETPSRVNGTWIGLIKRGIGLLRSLGYLWVREIWSWSFRGGFELPVLNDGLQLGGSGNSC